MRFNDLQSVVVNNFENVLVIFVKSADVHCVVGVNVPVRFWRPTTLTPSFIVENKLTLPGDAIMAPAPLAVELRRVHDTFNGKSMLVGAKTEFYVLAQFEDKPIIFDDDLHLLLAKQLPLALGRSALFKGFHGGVSVDSKRLNLSLFVVHKEPRARKLVLNLSQLFLRLLD